MFWLIIFIIIIFVILYFIYNKIYKHDNLIKVKSPIDNEYYWVRDKNDKINAVITLSNIKINMKKLVSFLQTNQNKFPENMSYIKDLVSRTKTINILETPQDDKYTSYTINKGESINFCLRSKIIDNIHDMNTLMYVVIHEMAHVGCPEYGHTKLFKQIFKFLLQQSIEIGLYKPIDYRINPQNYCGMTINEYILD
jgi:hypothetical protein